MYEGAKMSINIGSFVVDPEYRSFTTFKMLVATFLERIYLFIEKGIYIQGIFSFIETPIGSQLAQGFGMKKTNFKYRNADIYTVDFNSSSFPSKLAKKIFMLIKNKREDFLQKNLEDLGEQNGIVVVKKTLDN
jgi:hypothetical protein